MCRYIVVQVEAILDESEVIAADHEYSKACDLAEDYVEKTGRKVEVFERVSTAVPTTAVKWEGKRRPALSATGA